MTVVFLGVVLGVDSRLGYWDLVGGGEIRNMVIVVFVVIIIIITIIILDPIYTIHITMVLLYILLWFQALGSSGQVTALDLSPDGRFLAIGTDTSVVKVGLHHDHYHAHSSWS